MSNDPKRSQPKVLHVLTQMAVGGAQKNTLFTVGSQLAQGWDVHLVAGPPVEDGGVGLLSEAQQLGDRLHLEPALVRRIAPALDGLALARLIRLMRQHRFDVVHTHSSKAGILGRLAASISGVPVVIHTVHGWGFHDRQSAAVQRFYVQLERKAAGVTSRWITVSDRDARVGVERGIAPASAFAIIRSGIDIDAFARARLPRATVRQQLGLPLDARVLGTVGRLSQQKDPLSFVRAARHVADSVPGTHFVMVGDGELRPQVEAEIARLGLGEQFVITGFRPDVPELLQSFDVFALSSLWEGLPRVVPEAMAAGLPVVATRTCGTEEAMDPGRSGYLVPPAQPKALANRAAALLASPEQAAAMGQHGKQYLSDEFSRQRMVERIASVVRSELASARRIPVLYLITELGVGGAQSSLARLLRRLDRDRYAPTVACLFGGEGAIAKQIRALGIDVVDLGMRHKGRVDALARLAGLIRRLRPTILQSLLFHADMAARTVGSACRVPVVITSRRNTRIGPLYREQIRRATA
ncbi:MAG: glycosyltransferase involved in cell wall biosynthesis, partial [Myxococcota bacterium]